MLPAKRLQAVPASAAARNPLSCPRFTAGLCALALLASSQLSASAVGQEAAQSELDGRAAELQRRRQTPGGLLPLLDLLGLWDQGPSAAVEQVLVLARQRQSHPLVRGYGDFLAALAAQRRGDQAAARRLADAAGFTDQWLLLGPLASASGEQQSSPEVAQRDWPELSKSYQGKNSAVSWRQLPFAVPGPRLSLGSLLEPRQQVTALLQTFVTSKRAQAAALRLGTAGAYRVFLNGQQVAAKVVDRQPRADQEAVGLWLQRGTNRLLLELSVEGGPWDVYARLTDLAGGPLPQVTVSCEIPAAPALAAVAGRRVQPLSLASWLAEQERQRPGDAGVLRDLARYHSLVGPTDKEQRAAEQAARGWVKRAPSVEGLLLLAGQLEELNSKRMALEQALALAPAHPRALHQLGELRRQQGLNVEAVALWRQALVAEPGYFPAAISLAEAQRSAGLEQLAARQLDALLLSQPQTGAVLAARAELAASQNLVATAERLYTRLLRDHQDDPSLHKSLAELALRRGQAQQAQRHLQQAVQQVPQLIFPRLDLARLLLGQGQLAESAAACEQALAVDPRAVAVLELYGEVQRRLGRPAAAMASWRRALAVQPQNAKLRQRLSLIDPAQKGAALERYRIDPAPLIAAAGEGKGRDGAPAEVLLELRATAVHENGLSRTLHQRLVLIRSEAGAEQAASFSVSYSPDRQAVKLHAARVHRRDGAVVEAAEQQEVSLSEPWARLWYDTRALVLKFSGLKPGDVVEVEYLVEDVGERNLLADYFGDLVFVQQGLPVRRFEHVLSAPRGRSFYFRHPRLPQVRRQVKLAGEQRVWRWSARDIPRVQVESGMPGWSDVADYLHVSTYKSWSEVVAWYQDLVSGQLTITPRIRKLAAALTGEAGNTQEKVRAIHNFVVKKTRYIGLEFGIHSYKPYAADQVLSRKFGDCKDKAGLLVALLRAAGVEAQMVLVRTDQRGAIDPEPASLAVFDHAIAYVPELALYLDGTAEHSGGAELPAQDQGVAALWIAQGERALRRTPLLPAAQNSTLRTDRWRLAADGSGELKRQEQISGQAAAGWRARYQAADQRRQSYEKLLGQVWEGIRVERVQMSDLGALEQPVRVEATARAPAVARQVAAQQLELPVLGQPSTLTRTLARLSSRQHPLVLPFPWTVNHLVQVDPPAGWLLDKRPRSAKLSSRFGQATLSVAQQGNRVEARLLLTMGQARISPADYQDFRAFLLQVDQLTNGTISLRRGRP